jgi:hypothetical protein
MVYGSRGKLFLLLALYSRNRTLSIRRISLRAPQGKKRIVNRFAAADRASARRGQPFPFGKNKPTASALGRDNLKHPAAGVQAAADMLKMGANLLFREVERHGNTLGRDWSLTEKGHNTMTGRLLGRAGNHWGSYFFLHDASPEFECTSGKQQRPLFFESGILTF